MVLPAQGFGQKALGRRCIAFGRETNLPVNCVRLTNSRLIPAGFSTDSGGRGFQPGDEYSAARAAHAVFEGKNQLTKNQKWILERTRFPCADSGGS